MTSKRSNIERQRIRNYIAEIEARDVRKRKLSDEIPVQDVQDYWDDIQNSLIGKRLASVAGTVAYNFAENTVDFSANGDITDVNDTVGWNVQLPHGADLNSTLNVHIHFEQSDNLEREITIRYRIQSNSEAKTINWTTVVVSTNNAVWPYVSGTLNNILPLVSIDISNAGLSDIIQIQMTRSDAQTGLIPVLFADAHVRRSALGTIGEFS